MYGNELNICIRCKNEIIGYIVDIFGKDIIISNDDESHFKAYVKASKQGMKYLALQYLDGMEVLSPPEVRNEIIEMLHKGVNKYEENS